jgi:hypothetical protein
MTPAILRTGLFLVAASLAFYIPYKYATQLHAITGFYAFLFPLSGVLALAGMVLAVKPQAACDCSGSMRGGAGIIAAGWMATGLMCIPSLTETVRVMPLGGAFAMFHMLTQHVVLPLAILAFAVSPYRAARVFGASAGPEFRNPKPVS